MNNIFGINDAANLTLKKKSDGKVFLYSDYATVTTNDWKANRVYAMTKSTRAVAWDKAKESTMKVTLEIFDLKWLSMLTGSDFVKGSTNIRVREELTVVTGNKVTITGTPIAGSLQVNLLESDGLTNGIEQTVGIPGTTPNTYSITGSELTFNVTTCPVGTKVVVYYLKASDVSSQTMTISANKFPFAVEIIGDTMIRDTDQQDKMVQFYVPNAKAKSDFTITLSSTDITKLEVEFDLFKDAASDTMMTYTII